MVLGLDVARHTGWAVGFASVRAPLMAFWDLPPLDAENLPRACAGLHAAITGICRQYAVSATGIEAPLRGIKRRNKRGVLTPVSFHGERVLTMLSGAAQAAASPFGPVFLVEPPSWRKSFLGAGFVEDADEACVRSWQRLGSGVTDRDAAEAGGIWFHTCGLARRRAIIERGL